jgi:hypothetical protein
MLERTIILAHYSKRHPVSPPKTIAPGIGGGSAGCITKYDISQLIVAEKMVNTWAFSYT